MAGGTAISMRRFRRPPPNGDQMVAVFFASRLTGVREFHSDTLHDGALSLVEEAGKIKRQISA